MKQKIISLTLTFIVFLSAVPLQAQVLTGTYTVGGSNADFPTLTAAANAIMTQGGSRLTLEIRPGTYNESVIFDFWDRGAYPLTIKGTNVTITSSNPTATLSFKNGSSLTFGDGIKVINTSSVGSALLLESFDFSTIQNCTFQSNGGPVIKLNLSEDNTFNKNTILGGDYGIYCFSSSDCIFYDNTITGFKNVGILTESLPQDIDHWGYTFEYNQIAGGSASGNQSVYAIWINEYAQKVIARRNEIMMGAYESVPNSYGIYVSGGTANLTLEKNHLYANNPLYAKEVTEGNLVNNSFYSYGRSGIGLNIEGAGSRAIKLTNNEVTTYTNDCIRLDGGTYELINNSTFLYETASTGSAFRINSGRLTAYNNSFYNNSRTSGTYAVYIASSVTVLACNYNNFYSLSPSLGVYKRVEAKTLTQWKSLSGMDANSISQDPLYADPELGSLQIGSNSPLVNRALASVMPSYDNSTNPRKYNAIGAHDPYSYPIGYSIESEVFGSVEEVNSEITIQSYNEEIIISYPTDKLEQAYICVVNVLTQEQVGSLTVNFSPEVQEKVINLSTYPAGYYIVNVVSSQKTLSQKVYKK